MSLRNRPVLSRLVMPAVLSALAMLVGCGNGSPTATPPPSGSFSNSNLSGTYVFSVSGTDDGGSPFAMVGALIANGTGGITGGTIDINDLGFAEQNPVIAPVANAAISASSPYTVGVDGRGRSTLKLPPPSEPSLWISC